jgi:repressor LexA
MKTFGDRLKELRMENGLTQKDLIKIIKEKYCSVLSKSMISKWENNLEEPARFTDVIAFAEYFGVTTDYLIGITEDKYSFAQKHSNKAIPLLGTIAAGVPILAQVDIQGYEFVNPDEQVDFCLRIKGNSMIGARIFDGDTIFIHKQDEVENGEIAAVQIDGEEATCKRFYKDNGKVTLHSENPTIPDMIYTAKDKKLIKVLGKVKYVKFEAR